MLRWPSSLISMLPYSTSVLLSKAWLYVTVRPWTTPQAWTHSPPFPTTSTTELLFIKGLISAFCPFCRWHRLDSLMDLSKASRQRVAFGNQTVTLSCSQQHSPWSGIRPAIVCSSRNTIACNVILCYWQARTQWTCLIQKKHLWRSIFCSFLQVVRIET